MTIMLTLSYDGTNYCGWQVQPNGVSVQQVVQSAVSKVVGASVKVTGSGRTDAGVHALGQTASFFVENCTVPPEKFYKAINTLLPNDIRALSSQAVEDGFNACKNAKKKTYSYNFYYGEVENPILERYSLLLKSKPNLALINECKSAFIGEKDFKCFNASGGGAKTTVRTVYDIEIVEKNNSLKFLVTGNGFLYNMVRTMAGTLLDVGYGLKTKEDLLELLRSGDRSLCGKTLPPKALILEKVEY